MSLLDALRDEKLRLEAELSKVNRVIKDFGGNFSAVKKSTGVERKVRKPMSKAARAKISAAQKLRWQKQKKADKG